MADRTPMKLADELRLYGSGCDAGEFNNLIQELHAVMHPAWSIEDLCYEPRHAAIYCEAVRARAGSGLPDRMIMKRLTNCRKRGAAK